MKITNFITFEGQRDSMTSTGNVEYFSFKISSAYIDLNEESVKQIVNMHGFGGQSFSETRRFKDGINIYEGKTTRYSD